MESDKFRPDMLEHRNAVFRELGEAEEFFVLKQIELGREVVAEWLRFRYTLRFFEIEAAVGQNTYGHMKVLHSEHKEFFNRLDDAIADRMQRDTAQPFDRRASAALQQETRSRLEELIAQENALWKKKLENAGALQ
jgi:hypothetical protein